MSQALAYPAGAPEGSARRATASIGCHERGHAVRLRHAGGARRPATRPGDGEPCGADLPDGGVRLRGHRPRGESVRVAALRERLFADHESDDGRVRGTNRRPGERHRSGGHVFRAGSAAPGAVHADGGGRRVRLLPEPLRRQLSAVRRELPQGRDQRPLRRRLGPRPVEGGGDSEDQGVLCRDDREPDDRRDRHRAAGRSRARERRPARRRQHVRVPVPVPAARVGGGHRGPFRDEVHLRSRHGDRWRDRRRAVASRGTTASSRA